jgi:hypothetical protein
MRIRATHLLATLAIAGCAPTTSTGTLPVEVLVVLDQASASLVLIAVDSTEARRSISLAGIPDFTPQLLAARGNIAVVIGVQPKAVIVDLTAGPVGQPLLLNFVPSELFMTDAGIAYAGSPQFDVLNRIDPVGHVATFQSIAGGVGGFGVARGRLYAVVANRVGCDEAQTPPCNADGQSWLTELAVGAGADSIPISGPGNAGRAVAGPDGLLYVLNRGDGAPEEGRLSAVDPITNAEIASYGGFGPGPRFIASDGLARILIASQAGGLMEFSARDRRVVRGFGSGISLRTPADLLTDALGRAYVVEFGGCTADNPGRVRVFGTDLVEGPDITLPCPVAAAVGEVPADLFATVN